MMETGSLESARDTALTASYVQKPPNTQDSTLVNGKMTKNTYVLHHISLYSSTTLALFYIHSLKHVDTMNLLRDREHTSTVRWLCIRVSGGTAGGVVRGECTMTTETYTRGRGFTASITDWA